MADNSKIEWTDATWNPIRAWLKSTMIDVPPQRWGYHCERISPGCKHCYASTMNGRMLPAWGTGLDYTVPNREKVEILLDEGELLKPLKWRSPKKIFPCSMTDWCADFVTDEMRDRMLAVAALCPQHTFLFLTKRADRCAEYFGRLAKSIKPLESAARSFGYTFNFVDLEGIQRSTLPFPWHNTLLGFSAENQECFNARWSHMRKLAAAGWPVWCSAEPLIGPTDMKAALTPTMCDPCGHSGFFSCSHNGTLSWVVTGAESGHGARPCEETWVRGIKDQCVAAGVPFFYKQAALKGRKVPTPELDGQKWMQFPARRGM